MSNAWAFVEDGLLELAASTGMRHFSRRRLRRGALCLLTALLVLIVAYALTPRRHEATGTAYRFSAVTAFQGCKGRAALSPDGNQIAFSLRTSQEGSRHIYIKGVTAREPIELTSSSDDDEWPDWSPDARQIAFCRRPASTAAIDSRARVPADVYVVPATGGAARRVAQSWAGVSWSADGQRLAIARVPEGSPGAGGIEVVALDSGARRKLTAAADAFPEFSPDGKWVAFMRTVQGHAQEIFVVPTAGGEARQLTIDGKLTNGITWTTDSREIVFSSSRSSADGDLWRVPLSGGSPQPVLPPIRHASTPSIARSTMRLAFAESWRDSNIYLRTGSGLAKDGSSWDEPNAVIVSARPDHSPELSPDGQRIAFVTSRSEDEEIWTADRNGGEPFQVTSLGRESMGSPRWSPEGSRIAFDVSSAGESDVYVVNSLGGPPQRLSMDGESWMPAWSRDGESIYFTSRRSGTPEIWRMTAAGGTATRMTHAGGYEARPSRDRKTLFFSKTTPAGCCEIWSMPAEGGLEQPVEELEKYGPISRSWGVLADGIYFIAMNDPRPVVRFLSFGTRKVSDILQLDKEPGWSYPALSISADGRQMLYVQIDGQVDNLTLVQNFR